ncbi:AAA family ATPase [Cytobacillus sp. Hz8]|uniref:ATP-binding protein n=1 Tax=Cytobacillus sp. Hz8 TaxID=3347168 RepID=UPI0035DF3C64
MKILEIHIYGYGKLENFVIKEMKDLQTIYGENEAGKSTIMMFIHSILFGFPTKQQSELRYEPKNGAAYGGKLVLLFPEKGQVVVERVKGKATGDVHVSLEDGTFGGEELLKELLLHMDKSLYQSIFSFNLNGLQNVHLLKNEELGRFLFSAGTLGSEKLMAVEGMLQKNLDNYFKPNGKKPLLNEKLRELKAAQVELQQAGEQNADYLGLIQEKEALQGKIEKLKVETRNQQLELQKFQNWEGLLPLLKEEQALQEEMSLLEDLPFPIDGISRLNQLEQLIKPYEGQVKGINERIKSLEGQLKELKPNEKILQHEAEISSFIEKMPLMGQLKQEEEKLQEEKNHMEKEIAVIKENLHTAMDDEALLLCNTGISMKEQIETAEKEYSRLVDKKVELDERFETEKTRLEDIEQKVAALEQRLLPITKKQDLENQLKKNSNQEKLQIELTNIQDKMDFLDQTKKKQKQQKKKNQMILTILVLLSVIAVIRGIMSSQLMIAAGGAVVVIMLLFLLLNRSQSDKEMELENRKLKEKEKDISVQLKDKGTEVLEAIGKTLKEDADLRRQSQLWSMKREDQEIQYEKLIQAFDEWEHRTKRLENQLIDLREGLGLPKEITYKHIPKAFMLLENWKQYVRDKQNIDRQLLLIKKDMESISQEIRKWGNLFLKNRETLPLQEVAIHLKNSLRKENEKNILFKENKAKLIEWHEELDKLTVELDYLQDEKKKLFQFAKVENEETFRERGKMAEKQGSLFRRLDEINQQFVLANIDTDEKKQIMAINHIESLLNDQSRTIEETEQQLQGLHEKLADIKHKVKQLEDGGMYTDLLHHYKQLNYQFSEEAKNWARYAIAKDILSKTIEKYKEERLPRMLKKAEEYLSYLTNHQYVRIHAQNVGSGLLIERRDHTLFEANELSQATSEQVYVALRLALATTLYDKYQFPIVIDDSFVNFDHERTEKVIRLLQSIRDHQILFFTCHKHLLSYFKEEEILHLKESIIQAF